MKFRLRRRIRLSFWLRAAVILGTILFVLVMVTRGFRPTIAIRAEPVAAPVADPFRSRFLPSTFSFPEAIAHPVDPEGRPMAILAQINFDAEDPSKRTGYHVCFFPEVDRDPAGLHSDFSFLPDATNYGAIYLPMDRECSLVFFRKWEFISEDDYHFSRIYGENFFERFGSFENVVWNWFWEATYRASGHRIGGWAKFALQDPRPENEDWLILLQIDSDVDADIWWGDSGTGHFFIRPQELKNLDFSQVIYEYQSG